MTHGLSTSNEMFCADVTTMATRAPECLSLILWTRPMVSPWQHILLGINKCQQELQLVLCSLIYENLLKIPDSNDPKIAKISQIWTFWPVIQLINYVKPSFQNRTKNGSLAELQARMSRDLNLQRRHVLAWKPFTNWLPLMPTSLVIPQTTRIQVTAWLISKIIRLT